MSNEETIEILEELLNSVKSRGFRKTLNVLKTEKQTSIHLTDPYQKFIVETVAETFQISTNSLLFSRYIRGENKYAIGFCVFYLYERMTLGEVHKKVFKNKNKTLLSKYRQIIFDLNKAHKTDHKYIEIKSELDNKIENFKQNNQ
jgi:hypothetical protein